MIKEKKEIFNSNEQKRLLAEQRRSKMLEEKKKIAHCNRDIVIQRKHFLDDRISDIMSFVSNSENIWELLGNESDWQELGLQENDEIFLLDLISRDQFELEKLKLKRDAELLNQIIMTNYDGSLFVRKDLLPLLQKKNNQ